MFGLKIVFMGTPEFAVPSLKELVREHHRIVGVYTQPDRPKGRGNKLTPSPVKVAAQEMGLPVFQPEKIRLESVDELKALKPDLVVTAAFGQILSQQILDIAPEGNINVHASLLPRHRGAAPVAHAIMAGERETGVTTMFMDAGIDTGDKLLSRRVEIGESETCGELTQRLSVTGAGLLSTTIRALIQGTLRATKQNEEEATYDRMLDKSLSVADFTAEANLVRGRINGLNPWPCVSVPVGESRLKLMRAVCCEGEGEPGTVIAADPKEGLVVACGTGAVRVLEVQAPGGKQMKAEDYLRGHAIPAGTDLKEVRE